MCMSNVSGVSVEISSDITGIASWLLYMIEYILSRKTQIIAILCNISGIVLFYKGIPGENGIYDSQLSDAG